MRRRRHPLRARNLDRVYGDRLPRRPRRAPDLLHPQQRHLQRRAISPPPKPAVVKKKTAAQLKAEKLSKALKACHADKRAKKRKACEVAARRKFGPAKKAKAKAKAKK